MSKRGVTRLTLAIHRLMRRKIVQMATPKAIAIETGRRSAGPNKFPHWQTIPGPRIERTLICRAASMPFRTDAMSASTLKFALWSWSAGVAAPVEPYLTSFISRRAVTTFSSCRLAFSQKGPPA